MKVVKQETERRTQVELTDTEIALIERGLFNDDITEAHPALQVQKRGLWGEFDQLRDKLGIDDLT